MRELKELKLPQMVEARKREEEPPAESPITGHSHQLSQSSIMSDVPSPTFSTRGHSRMQSSTSSLPSSPTLMDSDTFGSGKRPLTDVKEEPLERDEDFQMIDSFRQGQGYREPPIPPRLSQQEWSFDDPDVIRIMDDLSHDQIDNEYPRNPNAKRQRPDASPLSGFASKMSSRMPSFSQKFRSRKPSPSVSIPPLSREASVSRANSIRALSISSAHGTQAPPTPAASLKPENDERAFGSFSQVQDGASNDLDEWEDQAKPSTPLLPPLMTDHLRRTEEETCQSPLQSPSVAEPDIGSVLHSPSDIPQTPQIPGYPSPPLSTRPSVASFHHRQYAIPPLIPSSEISPMAINHPPQDKWADALGHANFIIQPEPYIPEEVDLETCKILRSDWDTARHNYAKHLMRVEENIGPTSKIYTLTQEKWAGIDATWKKNVDRCVAQLNDPQPSSPGSPVISEPVGRDLTKTPPLVKIPALNGPRSEGKFPRVGDEGIVGPMEVVPLRTEVIEHQEKEQQAQAAKRKRKLGNFIKDWILGVGMFGSSKA